MSWLPRFSFPEEYFSPQAGLNAIFEALQRLGDGLLGIKNEILRSRKQILEAVQETTTRTSQAYLSFERIIRKPFGCKSKERKLNSKSRTQGS